MYSNLVNDLVQYNINCLHLPSVFLSNFSLFFLSALLNFLLFSLSHLECLHSSSWRRMHLCKMKEFTMMMMMTMTRIKTRARKKLIDHKKCHFQQFGAMTFGQLWLTPQLGLPLANHNVYSILIRKTQSIFTLGRYWFLVLWVVKSNSQWDWQSVKLPSIRSLVPFGLFFNTFALISVSYNTP